MRYTYDPYTRRMTEFYGNAAFCRLAGLAPELLCALVAGKDVPAPFAEVRQGTASVGPATRRRGL